MLRNAVRIFQKIEAKKIIIRHDEIDEYHRVLLFYINFSTSAFEHSPSLNAVAFAQALARRRA